MRMSFFWAFGIFTLDLFFLLLFAVEISHNSFRVFHLSPLNKHLHFASLMRNWTKREANMWRSFIAKGRDFPPNTMRWHEMSCRKINAKRNTHCGCLHFSTEHTVDDNERRAWIGKRRTRKSEQATRKRMKSARAPKQRHNKLKMHNANEKRGHPRLIWWKLNEIWQTIVVVFLLLSRTKQQDNRRAQWDKKRKRRNLFGHSFFFHIFGYQQSFVRFQSIHDEDDRWHENYWCRSLMA